VKQYSRLILSAVLNAIFENNEIADLYFETATSQEPDNVIAWTLYGKNKDSIKT